MLQVRMVTMSSSCRLGAGAGADKLLGAGGVAAWGMESEIWNCKHRPLCQACIQQTGKCAITCTGRVHPFVSSLMYADLAYWCVI